MKINEYIASQFIKPSGIGGIISTFIMNNMNKKQYQSVLNNMNIKNGAKILDIGFGNGQLLNTISKKQNIQCYGLEYSKDMLKRAKNMFKNLNLMEGSITENIYEKDMFDSIYTVNTIYFWDNPIKGLSEVKRILKEDGKFLNVFYSKEWLENIKYTNYGF
ncbi:MAG: class I SAM-dependent methyltransferase, partial [Sarcina sp.]